MPGTGKRPESANPKRNFGGVKKFLGAITGATPAGIGARLGAGAVNMEKKASSSLASSAKAGGASRGTKRTTGAGYGGVVPGPTAPEKSAKMEAGRAKFTGASASPAKKASLAAPKAAKPSVDRDADYRKSREQLGSFYLSSAGGYGSKWFDGKKKK